MQPSYRHLQAEESDLLRRLYPTLRRFAAVVGAGDMEPDDLVQEALVKTLRARKLTELSHPSSYLYRAMCSIATDQRRSLGRRRRALERIGNLDPAHPTYPSDLDDLEALAPRERAVLYFREIEGCSYEEIGEMLHAKQASLRRTASRARRHLRDAITEEARNAAS